MTRIQEANLELFKRYKKILNDYKKYADDDIIIRTKKMIDVALTVEMLEDKQSRWLGFTQGVLAVYDLIDIDTERDISRKLFHKAYKDMGLEKPKTISIS